jgi:hypothetical protein
MIRHLGQGEASVYPTVAWKQTEVTWTWGLQHRMIGRTVDALRQSSCVREPQRLCGEGGAPDELTPWKSIASDHPTVVLSAALSQRLV